MSETGYNGRRAFELAVSTHRLPLVRYFLQQMKPAEKKTLVFAVEKMGDSAISGLLDSRRYYKDERRELIPLFLDNPSFADLPILHIAIRLRDQRLLERVISINNQQLPNLIEEVDNEGKTPLLFVMDMDSDPGVALNFAKLLLANKANPMARMPTTGATCLHIAMGQRNSAMVEFLLSQTASEKLMVESDDNFGNTPLHALARSMDIFLSSKPNAEKTKENIDFIFVEWMAFS